MNNRIKELAEQAGFIPDAFLAKFAKLIIEECITIVNKRKDAAIDADWLVDEAMTNAVWDIEEQLFGIKEWELKNERTNQRTCSYVWA